jgi:hypothetical protein
MAFNFRHRSERGEWIMERRGVPYRSLACIHPELPGVLWILIAGVVGRFPDGIEVAFKR